MRRVLVLAVDDEATPEAAAIRSVTTAALRTTLEQQFSAGLTGFPTDWLRSDLRVVVVHPSITGSDRAVGPGDDPALAVVSDNASIADVDAMADAAARAIDGAVAPASARYSLIDATMSTVQLLAHTRPPVDAHESALVDSIGHPEVVWLAISTSRDDASAGLLGSAAWPPAPFGVFAVLSPLTQGSDPCSDRLDPVTRLSAWLSAARRSRGGPILVYAANAQCAKDLGAIQQSGLIAWVVSDSFPPCLPWLPGNRPEGGATCVVDVTMPTQAPCGQYLGMLDPLDPDGARRPRTSAADAGWPGRVCEVNELASPQAGQCSTMPTCADCNPGWCFAPLGKCDTGTIRFVHGAVPRGTALLHVVCDAAR